MIQDPARHEPLQADDWDAARVRSVIQHIVADAEQRFSPQGLWPVHPQDADGRHTEPLTPLYFGALGVIWALRHLRELGAAHPVRDYLPLLTALQARNRDWLGPQYAAARSAYLMGDTPFALLAAVTHPDDASLQDHLADLIAQNIDHPTRELMWGAPGTLLAALFMYERTGADRWAYWFRLTALHLWSQLQWSPEHRCHYWTQDLYGTRATYLDAVHGFVATASPLIRGRDLLEPAQWDAWHQCILDTVSRTATWSGNCVNWQAQLRVPPGAPPRFLMQFCHGAPGFVVCLGDLPSTALDPLLLAAGDTVWSAGPLRKGSNLCHGTGGNGYAFLKLFKRTRQRIWLERARAFAMHGIAQTQADARRHGQGRYSLWTGDIGFAVYLWHCLQETADFPTLDVF